MHGSVAHWLRVLVHWCSQRSSPKVVLVGGVHYRHRVLNYTIVTRKQERDFIPKDWTQGKGYGARDGL
jgi:hypothetical protein